MTATRRHWPTRPSRSIGPPRPAHQLARAGGSRTASRRPYSTRRSCPRPRPSSCRPGRQSRITSSRCCGSNSTYSSCSASRRNCSHYPPCPPRALRRRHTCRRRWCRWASSAARPRRCRCPSSHNSSSSSSPLRCHPHRRSPGQRQARNSLSTTSRCCLTRRAARCPRLPTCRRYVGNWCLCGLTRAGHATAAAAGIGRDAGSAAAVRAGPARPAKSAVASFPRFVHCIGRITRKLQSWRTPT